MNEQLDRIEKMLQVQLKSAGHIWWIGGFVYGQTSNDDVFVILYPAAENLKEKVVRVYDRDLKKLPAFIAVDIDGGDTEANPSKEQARKKGIYHECPAFEICTFDGRDTQMGKERRFGEVLRLSKAAREALSGAGGKGAGEKGSRGAGEMRPEGGQGQQQARAPQRPTPPPPPDEPADDGPGMMGLPNYRKLALEATTAEAFDYAAFMLLRNGLYTEVERITTVRQAIAMGWKPSAKSNAAMLAALEVYREKRSEAEGRGEAKTPASQFAKQEAMSAYNEAIKG
ncbi:protein of unknown function [Candidatus Promineifilum breve]|uniref:Uncharacterized protein n=1 Tax=Candidatus Promineifilum breve TaxID=1806508 RepID=A0A170PHC3_9CHLR|nr:protein of unknown function [Candidatus Promineifilum breve]